MVLVSRIFFRRPSIGVAVCARASNGARQRAAIRVVRRDKSFSWRAAAAERRANGPPLGGTARPVSIGPWANERPSRGRLEWPPSLMEDRMDTSRVVGWWDQVQPMLLAFGLKVIGAIVVFIVGRWLIRVAATLMAGAMTRQRVDSTVQHYIVSFVS